MNDKTVAIHFTRLELQAIAFSFTMTVLEAKHNRALREQLDQVSMLDHMSDIVEKIELVLDREVSTIQ